MTVARDGAEHLLDGQAHLWWARPDAFRDPEQLAHLRALLSDEERSKTDRYRFERDRHACLVTRALVRVTLSRYHDVIPARWQFRTNTHGRPEVAWPVTSLRFNVSHTDGLIVCLVSRGREVGVDTEHLNRVQHWLDLADRFFSPEEGVALRQVTTKDRPTKFLEYWTLKESYIKARGMGLELPLSGFVFDLSRHTDDIKVRFTSAINDDAARWQFTVGRLGKGHLVATALERRNRDQVAITYREACEPLLPPPQFHTDRRS
ncbi:MAG: 4'-phosphopantetheinyl transferase superfamily protein [Acidobacteriota bacterium]|nr:4'-phosphopantetheinyl transferase superfamily protein [Acidobacteriota bacterium]